VYTTQYYYVSSHGGTATSSSDYEFGCQVYLDSSATWGYSCACADNADASSSTFYFSRSSQTISVQSSKTGVKCKAGGGMKGDGTLSAMGSGTTLYLWSRTGSTWSQHIAPAAVLGSTSHVQCRFFTTGYIYCLISNGQIQQRLYSSGAWSGSTNLPSITSNPNGIAPVQDKNVIVSVNEKWIAAAASNSEAIYWYYKATTTWAYQGYVKGTGYVGTGVVTYPEGMGMAYDSTESILVTCRPSDDSGIGGCWVYKRSGTPGTWTQVGSKITPPSSQTLFGLDVAFGDNRVFIGSGNGVSGGGTTAVLNVYAYDSTGALSLLQIIPTTLYTCTRLSIAFANNFVMMGASYGTGAYSSDSKMFFFSKTAPPSNTLSPTLAPTKSPTNTPTTGVPSISPTPLPTVATYGVRKIRLGRYNTCYMDAARQVRCWGNELALNGQESASIIGTTPGSMSSLPPINFNADLLDFNIGDVHGCVITTTNALKCWGNGGLGRLGLNSMVSYGLTSGTMGAGLPTVDLGAGVLASTVYCSDSNTCMISTTGRVKCWGVNTYGQCGQGNTVTIGDTNNEMGDVLQFIDLGSGVLATKLCMGTAHVCAIVGPSSLKCWGWNAFGQLGLGHNNNMGDNSNEMGNSLPFVDLGIGSDIIKDIACGTHHTCVLYGSPGKVKCWGAGGDVGRLGTNNQETLGDQFGEMGSFLQDAILTGDIVALSAGWGTNCFLLSDHTAKCFGGNSGDAAGALMRGDTNNVGYFPGSMESITPINLGGYSNRIMQIAVTNHACAVITKDPYSGGEIYDAMVCWGENGLGQRGIESTVDYGGSPGEVGGRPVDILPLTILSTVTVSPTPAPTYRELINHLQVGPALTCMLTESEKVRCFGSCPYGICGTGDSFTVIGISPGDMDAAQDIDLGTDLTLVGLLAVSMEGNHACAVSSNSPYGLKCWGRNEIGQLGLGDTNNRGDEPGEMGDSLPEVDLGTGLTAQQIGCGIAHTCVLLSDSSVKCFGINTQGQLGQGHNNPIGVTSGQMGNALPAIDFGTGKTATQLSVGSLHSCVLLNDNSVKCWGVNEDGQLGQGHENPIGYTSGQMGDALLPINHGSESTPIKVVAGGYHTCILFADGSVKCFGRNYNGQLGIGSLVQKIGVDPSDMGEHLLVAESWIPAVDIFCGRGNTCIIGSSSNLRCWGSTGNGILMYQGEVDGIGTTPEEMAALVDVNFNGQLGGAYFVSISETHICVSYSEAGFLPGEAICWGSNEGGQRGIDSDTPYGIEVGETGGVLPKVILPIRS